MNHATHDAEIEVQQTAISINYKSLEALCPTQERPRTTHNPFKNPNQMNGRWHRRQLANKLSDIKCPPRGDVN